MILALFCQLGSAVASVQPQGLRQLNVIAEGAEIVPNLPDAVAGWCWICLAASKALAAVSSGGLCLASALFDQGYLGEN